MFHSRDELERPRDWLRSIEEQEDGFRQFLNASGSLAFAAFRIARARSRSRGEIWGGGPTIFELESVAVEIAERVGWHDPMPTRQAMAAECVGSGLPVGGALAA